MESFVIFKYLHVVAMFFFVAMAVSGELVTRRVAASHDVGAIRTTVRQVKVLVGPVASVLLVAGIAFGVIAALTGQINLLAPWLIIAYVTFLAAIGIGFGVTDPWVGRLERAAQASAVETPYRGPRGCHPRPCRSFRDMGAYGVDRRARLHHGCEAPGLRRRRPPGSTASRRGQVVACDHVR